MEDDGIPIPIPPVNIGGVSVPSLILGHLPFVGESYQGDERNKEYVKRFSRVEYTGKVIAKVVREYGITAIAATPATESKLARLLLDAVREVIEKTQTELSLIPCFRISLTIDGKPIDDYRRWITYYAFERRMGGRGLLKKYLTDPILLCRSGWGKRFPETLSQSSPYNREEIEKLQINYSGLEKAVASLDGFDVILAEAGSESDFLTMTGRFDLLEEFTNFLEEELKCPVLLGIHHAGTSIPILEEKDVAVVGYITPVNSLGALMLPSKDRALKGIKASEKPIIAIKPLAGGRIPPRRAFEYVFSTVGVDACMVGVASETEVDEDLQRALRALRLTKP